ncbi:MAG: ribonuclease D [Deltaproteobacteria bacterium]|nr:ribonuclease D [Deltaproteobacteria bacterium]
MSLHAPHQPAAPLLCERPDQLAEVAKAVAAADRIAIDTEFHGERSYYPRLMLLQVATAHGVWLIDPLALDLRPFVQDLARGQALVVGHALKNDLRILWQAYDAAFERVFDTQVAAAFLGCGLQMGLSQLVQRVAGVHLAKGEQMADWNQRPLPTKLRQYAANDVAHLLQVHAEQARRLHELGRTEWLDQECQALCDTRAYDRDPATAGDRVAGARRMDPVEAGVLYAVAALRETMAQQEDAVPHFLVTDEALVALARAKPRTAKDIHADRRLQTRVIQKHADRWVQAVAHGLAHPLKRPAGRPPPPPQLEAVASAAMLLVGELANASGIAPQLLTRRETLIDALREGPASCDELADHAGLHGWRRDLVAPRLWQLLSGELSLRCEVGGEAGFRLALA